MSFFSELGLAEPILRALETKGYADPTPIQQQAIPALMQGRDLLGIAQTGTGKTAAFSLPSLHRLAANPQPRKPASCRSSSNAMGSCPVELGIGRSGSCRISRIPYGVRVS